MKTTTKLKVIMMGDNPATLQALNSSLSALNMDYSILSIADLDSLFSYLEKVPRRRPIILFLDANHNNCKSHIKTIRNTSICDDITVAVYDPAGLCVEEEMFATGANIYLHKQKDLQQFRETLKKVISVNWHFYASSLNRETFFYYA